MTEAALFDREMLAQLMPFDPFDPEFVSDPYPTYRRMRENGPVLRTPVGMVFVTGHEEASRVLRDPAFGWGDGDLVADQFVPNPDGPPLRPLMFLDPPDHTRIRSLVGRAFSGRAMERIRHRAEAIVERLVAEAVELGRHGPVDLVTAVAHPLQALVLGELMGVGKEHYPRFRGWAADSARGLDPIWLLSPEEVRRRDEARAGFRAHFAELVEARRAAPADDLVSQLVVAQHNGDRLTDLELVTTCATLLAAGYGTTVNLVAGGMLALLRNPDQLAWLRAHPDRVPDAVEELIRYDSPIQVTSRVALRETRLGDLTLVPGEPMFVLIGAANRDPAAYPDPDRLDLSRPSTRNLGFGHGIHFCIGAPMARITARAAFAALIRLDVTLASEDIRYAPGLVVRGPAELPVHLREAR
jgi:unspecific monooxygenase